MKVGINGMGRIGRLAYRALRQRYPQAEIICADRNPTADILPLMCRDSLYGHCDIGEPSFLEWPEKPGHMSIHPRPDWPDVDIVLECAGGGPDGHKARWHLEHGAKRVIISAPADNVDATLVLGVNADSFDSAQHCIISMASCTTNCVGPLLHALNRVFHLGDVWMDSVNAYTNSQRIVDAPHRDPRRARAAALNIIPTESSTGESIGRILPWLKGRYGGRAFRVPVACGSLVSITAQSYRVGIDAQQVNNYLQQVAANLPSLIAYSEEPLVSSDIIGDSHSAIVDGLLTEVRHDRIHLVAWYDNELAYAYRLADMAALVSGEVVCVSDTRMREAVGAWGR